MVNARAAVAIATSAAATRPSNVSICDFYSTALLNASNATTQYTLVNLLVNTAVIGNYTTPNELAVPGILAQGAKYNGTSVNLLPYFDGAFESTNTGKKHGVSVNFLDGGGVAPLKENKPAKKPSSNQYTLLTHLYSYFGILLGCSDMGSKAFPAYKGDISMYSVHKYMGLDAYEVQYFIEQVGLSAASFGVAQQDIEIVGHALQDAFGFRCARKSQVVPGKKKELQSICVASDCPEAPQPVCKAYGTVEEPKTASAGSTKPSSTSSSGGGNSGGSSSSGSGNISSSTISNSTAMSTSGGGQLSTSLGSILILAGSLLVASIRL